MQSVTARLTAATASVAREARRWGLAAALVVVGTSGLQDAVATGETRSLALRHTHRGDDITVTFKRNGVYDDDALKKLNYFLRDWRTDDQIRMDPHLFDILWEVSREVDATEPINIVSSYRSPKTNEMLRRRGRGVARQSQHMLGRAIDFYIPGAPLEGLRNAGLRLQRGGVGFYPTSGSPFIHLDTGSVRHWPRLSREQLARVFPDGRTVHLPSDGQPLAGYALAAADVEKRTAGSDTSAARPGERPGRSLFARIFGIGKDTKDEDDESEAGPAKQAPAAAPRQVAALDKRPVSEPKKPAQAPVAVSMERLVAVPLPSARPAQQPVALASIARVAPAKPPVASKEPAEPTGTAFEGRFALAAMTPNEIVATRGFWRGVPEAPPRAQVTSPARETSARVALASAEPSSANIPAHSDFSAAFAMFKDSEGHALAYAPERRGDAAGGVTELSSSLRTARVAAAPITTGGIGQTIRDRVAPLFAPRRAYAAAGEIGVAVGTDDVWTRAIILAPDLQNHLTTSLLGAPDFVALRPLLHKPAEAIVASFASDGESLAQPPLSRRFDGEALIFPAVVSFNVAAAK